MYVEDGSYFRGEGELGVLVPPFASVDGVCGEIFAGVDDSMDLLYS